MVLWSPGLAISLDKQKTYLLYHSAYGYQTWQDSELPWGAFTYRVTWDIGYVVLQDHVINQNHYISTSVLPIEYFTVIYGMKYFICTDDEFAINWKVLKNN